MSHGKLHHAELKIFFELLHMFDLIWIWNLVWIWIENEREIGSNLFLNDFGGWIAQNK
jgi:hypothetical protein